MVSKKPWSLEAAARLFLNVILTLVCGSLLAGLAEMPKLHWTRDQRDFAEMILLTIFFQGSALWWIGIFLRRNGLSWSQAFFASRGKGRAGGIGLLVGGVSAWGLVMLQEWLTLLAKEYLHVDLQAEELVQKLSSPTISLAGKIFVGVTAILVAPVAEEALFRGVMYPTLKQRGYPTVAWVFTSTLFGLAHGSMMSFVPLTLFSMILIWLYEICDNLMAPIMAHCALNAINYYWIVSSGVSVTGAH